MICVTRARLMWARRERSAWLEVVLFLPRFSSGKRHRFQAGFTVESTVIPIPHKSALNHRLAVHVVWNAFRPNFQPEFL
jgi:hypothetical protein